MLSKNKIKLFSSLPDKKSRIENNIFLVEGEKMILELLSSGFTVQTLLFTKKMKGFALNNNIPSSIELIEISDDEASKISSQKTPQGMMAVASIPDGFYSDSFSFRENNLVLALQDIQDPGNLGTIIRTADWFGVKHILCSKSTVDVLNPKVLQSTMGAVFRVKVVYTDLLKTIRELKENSSSLPLFAAILDGNDLYRSTFPLHGILMMGNESKGLSEEFIRLATHKLTIPRFGNSIESSESLNVSIATAILLSEIRRKSM
jgi:TrmH family RNA methyltransferase